MFTNKEILRIALEQSAIDSNCQWDDFLKKENVIVPSVANPAARKYLKLPHVCDLTTYIKSARNAIRSGFRPAWAQLTVKPLGEINEMNGIGK